MLVALSREEAERVQIGIQVLESSLGACQADKSAAEAVRRALAVDPDELVERIAKALWEGGRAQAGSLIAGWDETRAETAKASTRQLARAVLAVIGEEQS
ncbi:MAG: hypothetical protein J0H98_10640 [Solirubrobacterales bacterium]|nr:hypothetical protein [Solirubrobacterales bacterium]